jgi:hypothetical protein
MSTKPTPAFGSSADGAKGGWLCGGQPVQQTRAAHEELNAASRGSRACSVSEMPRARACSAASWRLGGRRDAPPGDASRLAVGMILFTGGRRYGPRTRGRCCGAAHCMDGGAWPVHVWARRTTRLAPWSTARVSLLSVLDSRETRRDVYTMREPRLRNLEGLFSLRGERRQSCTARY